MKPLPIASFFCVALLGLGLAASAEASLIVNWGGEMVTANRNLSLPAPTDSESGGIRTWNWSSSSGVLNPTSGYTAAPFWGALQTTTESGVPAGLGTARITNNGTADYLEIRGSTANGDMEGFIFFKPEVAEGSTVSFDETSSLKLVITNLNYNPREVRMAVLNDGTWYLSGGVGGLVTGATTFSITNTDASRWAEWSGVNGAAPLPAIPGSYTISGSSFDKIEAVGFYFAAAGNGSSAAPRFEVNEFVVNAQVVPEPSTALLLLGSGAAYAALKLRRHGGK